jgi:hypothetical protein
MPFTLFKGTFQPGFGRPDGDSLRFVPDNPDPLFKLRRRGSEPNINPRNGSIQLRYEGIDTLEKAAIDPFASDATASNLNLAGTNNGQDSARGYVYANQLGTRGRLIALVYAGETDEEDGSEKFLEAGDIATSINVQQLQLGHAYPLYYDTFFHDLRDFCRGEVEAARTAGLGVWSADVSNSGFAWSNDLKNLPPIFPKLWRRIQKYMESETFFDEDDPAANLVPYIKSRRDERVLTLSDSRLTGFDNLVETNGDQVKLLADPNEMVVISEK